MAYAIGTVPFHLALALRPVGLLPTYPILRSGVYPWSESELWSAALVLGMVWAAFGLRRRFPWLLAALLFTLVGLLPTSGLISHGAWVLGAARYGYLPLLSVWVVVGGLVTSSRVTPFPVLRDTRTAAIAALLGAWLLLTGVSTYRQVQHWRSTEILWRHTVARDPANTVALNNLGFLLLQEKREVEALPFLVRALSIQRQNLRARLNLGVTLERLGRLDEALVVYQEGLTLHPGTPALHHNLSVILGQLGREGEAANHRSEAARLGFGAGGPSPGSP